MKAFMNYDFNIEKILLACYVPEGAVKTETHLSRPAHGLAFHTGGVKEYVFSDGRKIITGKNELIYLPKHSDYTVTVTVPGGCYAINFDISEEVDFSPFCVKTCDTSSYTKQFSLAKSIWEEKKNGYTMRCKSVLYSVICTLLDEYSKEYIPSSKLEHIKPAVDYIHTCYTREIITVEKLSAMCGITPEYFRKIFKGVYGISPKAYINSLKVERAAELIKSGMYSVSDAAALSGFSDMSHFSRVFKKATGVCACEYNKSFDA